MPEYVISSHDFGDSSKDASGAYTPYGEMWDYFHSKEPEIMISGGFDCGKTYGALQKINALMWIYPDISALMVRKSYSSLLSSALQSLYKKVLPYPPEDDRCPVDVYGGGVPRYITWPRGGRLWLGGMDKPGKVLSAEYDIIYVPQAEELSLSDWEYLKGRASGRAGGMPWAQIMGDCNPGPQNHWIINRPPLHVYYATHKDNPTIYRRNAQGELMKDADGNYLLTASGHQRMETLKSLTGLRYKRGFLGQWVGAEGLVYEDYDPEIHVVNSFPNGEKTPPYSWRKWRAIDFGYIHPFSCGWWAEDDDGRLYLYREIHMTRRTVRQHVEGTGSSPGILELSQGEKYEATICDWDAEDRATLEEYGIETVAADKRVTVGIEKVQERMRVQADGRPRIMILRDALVEVDERAKKDFLPLSLSEELSGYVYQELDGSRPQKTSDETPMKKDDDACDMARYLVSHVDDDRGKRGILRRYA